MRYQRGWPWVWLIVASVVTINISTSLIPGDVHFRFPVGTTTAVVALGVILSILVGERTFSWPKVIVAAVAAALLYATLNAVVVRFVDSHLGLSGRFGILVGGGAYVATVLLAVAAAYRLRNTGGRIEAFAVTLAVAILPALVVMSLWESSLEPRLILKFDVGVGVPMLLGSSILFGSILAALWVSDRLFSGPPEADKRVEREA